MRSRASKYLVLVIVVCFAVELLTMTVYVQMGYVSSVMLGVLDAALVAAALAAALYYWVFPRLMKLETQAKDQAQFHRTLINAIPAPIFYKDENGVYTGCNAGFTGYLGLPKQEIIGKSVFDIAPADLAEVYHKADMDLMQEGGAQVYETSVSHADGTYHDVMFHKAVYQKANGETGGIIGVILDITERKQMERRLHLLASLDGLTAIPNRREFENRLDQALARGARQKTRVAIIFIDLDGFKSINDRLGHLAGDQTLQQVAERLKQNVRKNDTPARMGGDEFAVLLDGDMNEETAVLVADKLLAALSEPYHLDGGEIAELSASMGISFAPDDGEDLIGILAKADDAMYRAKKSGKNRYILAQEVSA